MSDDYVTAATAADVLQVSRSTITRLCTQGKLDAVKKFETWLITRASLDERAALMAKKSSPRVSDAIINGTATQDTRPQVRPARRCVMTEEERRQACERQIRTATTYTYIDRDGNRHTKRRAR